MSNVSESKEDIWGSTVHSNPNYGNLMLDTLNNLRMNRTYCDFTLEVEGEYLYVHKLLLVVASPYFSAMLEHDMKESREGKAKFPEFKATALKAVVDYIYSGMIEITEDSVESIFFVSNFLQIDWVKDQCGQFLKQRMKVTNCFSTRRIADTYSCEELFDYCNKYILRHFPQLIDDEEFLQLSFVEFKAIITDDDLYVQSEENVYRSVLNWVKYDVEARRSHLPELMSHINLTHVRPKFLQNHILTEPLFENDLQCKDLFIKAMSHYLPTEERKHSSDTPKDVRRTQRRYGMPHVLFAGGENLGGKVLNTCRMYDISNKILYDKSSMNECRRELSAVSLNGLIYSTGGYRNGQDLKTVECYDTIINQWAQIASMANSRRDHGACVYNDLIYVVGGSDSSTVENYNPTTNKWYNCPNVPLPYFESNRTAVIQNSIYSIGDMENERMSNRRFNPREGRWYDLNSNTNYVCRFELASYGRSLYCIGGWSESFSNHCARFDVCCNKWETMSPMNVCRWSHSALTVDNKIYVFGGWKDKLVTTVERYDIPQNKWDTNVAENIEHINGAAVLIDYRSN